MSDPIPIDHVCASPPRQPSWRPRSFDADSPPWGAAPAPESPPWLPLPPPGRSHRTKRARSRPPPSLQLFVKLAGQSSIYSLPAAAARVADLRGAICARSGMPPHVFYLTFEGKILADDGASLAELPPDSTIHASLRGGSSGARVDTRMQQPPAAGAPPPVAVPTDSPATTPPPLNARGRTRSAESDAESDVDAVTRIKQPRRDDSGGGGGMDGGGMDRGSWSELQAGDGGFDLDEGLQLAFAGNTFGLTSPVPRDVDSPLMMES